MSEKTLDELIAETKKDYFRSWRANNKDKVKKHNQTFWAKKALQNKLERKEEK